MEQESSLSKERAREAILDEVKGLAQESGSQFCLYGKDFTEICNVFEIEVPEEVQRLFSSSEFRARLNTESILKLNEPIELRRTVQDQINFLYQVQMSGGSE